MACRKKERAEDDGELKAQLTITKEALSSLVLQIDSQAKAIESLKRAMETLREVRVPSAATKADLFPIIQQIDLYGKATERVVEAVRTLIGWTGWIRWFALGALVSSLWQFLSQF
jgi:prefoldin subunit 5